MTANEFAKNLGWIQIKDRKERFRYLLVDNESLHAKCFLVHKVSRRVLKLEYVTEERKFKKENKKKFKELKKIKMRETSELSTVGQHLLNVPFFS